MEEIIVTEADLVDPVEKEFKVNCFITIIQAPPKVQPKVVLNLKSAAEYLGISTRKLRALCARGDITYAKMSDRNYRFTYPDLNEYINTFKVLHKPLL